MTFLLIGLFIVPLLAALLVVALRHRPAAISWLSLVVSGLATLCALGLLAYAPTEVLLSFSWLPGFGNWSLHIEGVGLYTLILTAACAFVTRVLALRSRHGSSVAAEVTVLVALASASGAFLAGHFLPRYVALEIAALCAAAVVLVELRTQAASRAAAFVYVLFRLGDAGLLAAILLLFDGTGTLQIGEALQAGEMLSNPQLAWIAAGFVLAVWVKAGAWPFHGWLRVGTALSAEARGWMYGVLMPNLGLYLLYRVSHLLAVSALQPVFLGIGAMAVLLGVVLILGGASSQRLQIYGNTIVAGLALVGAALGASTVVAVLFLAVIPLRLWIWWATEVTELPPLLLGGRLETLSTTLRDVVETWVSGLGFTGIVDAVVKGAETLQRSVEQGVLDQGLAKLARAVVTGAQSLHVSVELGGGEGLLAVIVSGIKGVGSQLRRVHTGKLRFRLVWVVVSLVVGVVALVAIW